MKKDIQIKEMQIFENVKLWFYKIEKKSKYSRYDNKKFVSTFRK